MALAVPRLSNGAEPHREATASYDLNIKNGLPYCPRCNRQVSYRRDVCRACGYTFKTYGPSAPQGTGELLARRKARLAERQLARATADAERAVARIQRDREREARRAARREAREAYYREHGVEPGPWAWYRVLPEWQQAAFLGLAFAAPVVGLIVFLMR